MIPKVAKVKAHEIQVLPRIILRDKFFSIHGKMVMALMPPTMAPPSKTLLNSGGIIPGPIGGADAHTTRNTTSALKLFAHVTSVQYVYNQLDRRAMGFSQMQLTKFEDQHVTAR